MIVMRKQQQQVDDTIHQLGEYWSINRMYMHLVEEVGELSRAILRTNNIKEELGDVLFTTIAIANKLDINCNKALKQSIKKFLRRDES